MSREEMKRLKEKEDKTYVEAVRNILREKGTPFFRLSPSQFDKLSKGHLVDPAHMSEPFQPHNAFPSILTSPFSFSVHHSQTYSKEEGA